jgi:hypothetical protein
VLPGTYTVKMTRGKETYTTQLIVHLDPRATYTVEDRKLDFDAVMSVYRLLGDLSFDADRINGVHDALLERAGKLGKDDPLSKQLNDLAGKTEAMRKKIVATTEGGAITGEERIREKTTQLYGALTTYEGRPPDYDVSRIDSLSHDRKDVADEFDAFLAKNLQTVNASLAARKLEAIHPVSREAWEKSNAESEAGAPSAAGGFRDHDRGVDAR